MKTNTDIKKDSNKFLSVLTEISKKYFIIYSVVVLMIVLALLSDHFLTTRNLINVLRQSSLISIIAVGVFFVILPAEIDISVGSIVALSGITMSMVIVEYNWPVFLGILFALFIGALAGFINGYIVTKRGVPAFVTTLGMMGAARGLAFVLTDGYPISGLPSSIAFIGRGYVGPVPVPVIIMIIIYIIAYFIANQTKIGRFLYAIGGNREASYLSGIKVDKYVWGAFIGSGALAALSGIIIVSRIASGQPNAGLGYEFEAITAAVIGGTSIYGGKGKIVGVFFGALFIAMLLNGMVLLNISSYFQQMIKGLVLIGAVMLDVAKNKK